MKEYTSLLQKSILISTVNVIILFRLHREGRLPTLPVNIRQEWQRLTVTNTLAFYNTEIITAIKSL